MHLHNIMSGLQQLAIGLSRDRFESVCTNSCSGWVQSLDWTTGELDYWTHPNCKIHLIQCKTEAKHTYSLSYFANTAPYNAASFLEFLAVKGHVHI